MNAVMDHSADIPKISLAQLEPLGQDSLREHILAQAIVAHQKHGPLTVANLDALLHDPDCLRYPVRLIFELGEMAGFVGAESPEENVPRAHVVDEDPSPVAVT